jgi:transmembrane sensor
MTTNDDAARFEEACEWFLRLRETPESAEVVANWLAWCRVDSRNLLSFEEVRAFWWETRTLKLPASPRSTTAATSTNRSNAWHRYRMGGLAALFLICVAGIAGYLVLRSSAALEHITRLTTEEREHRIFHLADGSSVELAGDSRLSVRLNDHERSLRLERGEAYFQVARDPGRPFAVTAGATHVTALGTSFNVRATEHRVVVAVEEGVVLVERTVAAPAHSLSPPAESRPIRLSRGQEVSVGNHTLELATIEPAAVASWREGRLRFVREPLGSVVASVLAASGQRIELADERLGDLQFTGTVFSTRVSDWVEGLPSIYPVRIRREGASYVVSARE